MTVYIKNMVCKRCKMVVKSIFEAFGLNILNLELGIVELAENDISNIKNNLAQELEKYGFELLDNKKSKTIERIKNLITDLVHTQSNNLHLTLSEYLSKKLNQDYSTLSNLFSAVEGITIEKYYILHKVEKIKELLIYNEMTLSEIAFSLNYSSVGYLSNQFKKITGMTPSKFKSLNKNQRTALEEL